jgi:hypothetical protein
VAVVPARRGERLETEPGIIRKRVKCIPAADHGTRIATYPILNERKKILWCLRVHASCGRRSGCVIVKTRGSAMAALSTYVDGTRKVEPHVTSDSGQFTAGRTCNG